MQDEVVRLEGRWGQILAPAIPLAPLPSLSEVSESLVQAEEAQIGLKANRILLNSVPVSSLEMKLSTL